jgi:16S rRNA (adenine1518-N6/adenine1519-N6)-dimethyltransferase
MKAKKSLGQNFFINKNLGDHIVNKVIENSSDTVLEIGPGLGFFTERLTKHFKNVIVVEKDNELAQNLESLFPEIEVINSNFLDLDISKFNNITYFGSLPYNVSKPIIKQIITSESFTNPSYFIIQREVAEKYLYKKPYSILSLTTAIYADIERFFNISPDSFRPQPNVNSSFVCFKPRNESIKNKKELEKLIQIAFKQPRKNLKNNLNGSKYENIDSEIALKRAEELSLEDYKMILSKSSL